MGSLELMFIWILVLLLFTAVLGLGIAVTWKVRSRSLQKALTSACFLVALCSLALLGAFAEGLLETAQNPSAAGLVLLPLLVAGFCLGAIVQAVSRLPSTCFYWTLLPSWLIPPWALAVLEVVMSSPSDQLGPLATVSIASKLLFSQPMTAPGFLPATALVIGAVLGYLVLARKNSAQHS